VSAARQDKQPQTRILVCGPCGGGAHRPAPPPPQARRSHAQRMLHQIARLFGMPTAPGRTREPGNRAILIKPPDRIKPPRPSPFRRPDPFPVLRHRQAARRATATRHSERDAEMAAGR
jgi:hypothetical protein